MNQQKGDMMNEEQLQEERDDANHKVDFVGKLIVTGGIVVVVAIIAALLLSLGGGAW